MAHEVHLPTRSGLHSVAVPTIHDLADKYRDFPTIAASVWYIHATMQSVLVLVHLSDGLLVCPLDIRLELVLDAQSDSLLVHCLDVQLDQLLDLAMDYRLDVLMDQTLGAQMDAELDSPMDSRLDLLMAIQLEFPLDLRLDLYNKNESKPMYHWVQKLT